MKNGADVRNPACMLVWIHSGPGAGTFESVSIERGRELIAEGRAQDCAATDGRDLKPAARGGVGVDPERNEYATREMHAAETGGRRRGRTRH